MIDAKFGPQQDLSMPVIFMGVIPNPKIVFIFPISCILALIFPIVIKYFPKCERKGSSLKSQIKSLYALQNTIKAVGHQCFSEDLLKFFPL